MATDDYPLLRGGTVLGNIRGPKEHLFILCCDPVYYPHKDIEVVVTVNITSWKDVGGDPACVFDVGDHPFVVHRSFVYYLNTDLTSVFSLRRGIDEGSFKLKEPLSDEMMRRVIKPESKIIVTQ